MSYSAVRYASGALIGDKKTMMLVSTYVGPSGIEGVGIFAEEAIKAGTLIWELDEGFDMIVPRDKLDSVPEHLVTFFERYAYPLHTAPDKLVLEFDHGRFMNHQEQPNTDFLEVVKGYALRDIAAGEELTCNYSEFDPGFVLLPSFCAKPHMENGEMSAGF